MSKRKPNGAPGRRRQGSTPGERPASESAAPTGRSSAKRRSDALTKDRSGDATGASRDASPRGSSLLAQVALLVAVFVVTTLIAELAGAANLGVAIGVGQIAFVLALVALLLRAP